MESRRCSDAFAALVAAGMLILVAWGNALALLFASAVGLVIGLTVISRRERSRVLLTMLTAAAFAAAIVVFLSRHLR